MDKCVNKKLVKDNAKSFDDREGHSRDLMRCARRPKALPPCHIHAFIPHSRSPPHSRSLIHAVLIRPHSRHTYAAALTPHPCSSINAAALSCRAHTAFTLPHSRRRICAAALTPPQFCRRIHAAACTEPHPCSRAHTPAFTQPHVCCSIHAAAFVRRSHAAALMPSLSRCHIYAA